MAKRKPAPEQMAFARNQDGALVVVGEQESERTVVSTIQDARAAEIISIVTEMRYGEAEQVVRKAGGMHKLAQMPDFALQALPGVGLQRAKKIRALTDWGLLLSSVDEWQSVQLHTPADAANLVMKEMGLLDQEELRIIALDTKNRIIDMETVYRGSLNSAVVRIAELLRLPIALQSASMIMLHNHPSGDPTPSPQDVRITELVKESARQMDIDLLDHLIIGRNQFVRLKERGLGFG